MEQTSAKTYTDLYRLAQRWFIENPGQQLDLNDWFDQIYKTNSVMKDKVIYAGNHKVKNAANAVVPVLAAISLGMTSRDLATVIKHHKICLEHISDCIFEINDTPPFPAHPDDAHHLSLDAWRVTSEVIKAMSQDPELYEVMAVEARDYEDYPDLQVARLLCDNADFWPASSVRRSLAAKACGSPQISSIQPGFTDVYSFSTTNADFDQFSDEQIMTLLERSGHLCLGVTPENGFWCSTDQAFFNNLFLMLDSDDVPKNFTRIVQAINAVEDPDKIALIATKLTEILPHIPYERNDDGLKALSLMEKHLDQGKYGVITKNVALRINLVPVDTASGLFLNFEGEPIPACFEEIVMNNSTLLKLLSDEIAAIDPLSMGRGDFTAIRKAVKATRTPQETTGIDLPHLLKRVLLEFQAFQDKTHYTFSGATTPQYIEEALRDVTALIRFASKQPGIDYGPFQELPSSLKALLASNGFDIRKLPGISRHDKGQVLSDGLGL
jgi:hypothetical protein